MGRLATRWRRRAALATLVALLGGSLPAAPGILAAPPERPAERGALEPSRRVAQHRGTVSVASLARTAGASGSDLTAAPPPFLSREPTASGGRGAQAPDIQAASAPVEFTATANPDLVEPVSWAGASSPASTIEPPDPWVGVGPDHVVQVVNVAIRIWDRVGNGKVNTTLGAQKFFDLPPGFRNADPRFMYDPLHGRWIGVELSWTCDGDGNGTANDPVGFLDFVVSRTADPTGTWDLWFYAYPGELPDYPAAGWSSDKLGFTSNVFTLSPTTNCTSGAAFAYSEVLISDWVDLLANGGVNGELDAVSIATGEFTPRIATQVPATSSPLHIVSLGDSNEVIYRKVSGSIVAGTGNLDAKFDLAAMDVLAPSVEPPDPMQPGPDVVTSLIDGRITDAIWKDSRLTFVSTNGCTPTGDTVERACVRVSQLNTSSVSPTVPPSRAQDFLIAENGADHYHGGVGQSGDGTLHVVWTRCSTSAGNFPSSMHAYRLPSDPANRLSAPRVLRSGTAAYTGQRWGDYVGVAQDPQVPNAVWQGNQYSAGSSWATRVSQLQTPGSTYVPITPVRVLDTRSGIGLSGKFGVNSPRSWLVAGFGGGAIPTNALAVTGNLTVVNQSAAGYVAVTTTPTATPTSSTINFPLSDIRANNVTIPVATNGRLSAVYKAVAGSSTHLVFDVTGYFLPDAAQAAYTPVTPFRRIDSRNGTGMPGGNPARFASGVPRTFVLAGQNGIPGDAVAVTGNLTVVGQTHAGYLAITREAVAAPSTSNLNFPIGDIRANGFTAPLNATGGLSIVYAGAPSAARTDVVVDITGYYQVGDDGLVFHALNPGRIFDTRSSVLSGLTGMFTSKTPRQLATAGHWGIGADASAITGNLTVVGQQQAGYVSATTTSQAQPSTSTLNFPLGDIRANGITVPLNGTGGEWFVYVAGTGSRTHLLLDVTGYFAP